jgi:hypothetical protein
MWLPPLGWQTVDRELRRKLERIFSIPMIIMALMVLPLLAIEWGWRDQVRSHTGLRLFLDIGNSVIWMAFAIEFLVMISVADKKFRYCTLHWVDLAIILLPVVWLMTTVIRQWAELAPLARGLRLLRLSQLSRMGRLYRMQGLALKAWRAFLVLEVIQRLTGRSSEKQLKQLEELLLAKEDEVRELRDEIAEMKKRIAVEKNNKSFAASVDENGQPKVASTALPRIEIDTKANRT